MQGGEIVIRDGELLDLLTLSPIKSSSKNVVLQSTLRHLSLSYGIPISRFEIDWKYKSENSMLKADIVIYDSSANSKNLIGLIHCGKLPSLSEKSTITSTDEVSKIKKSFANLISICTEFPSVKYLLSTNSVDYDYMEKGKDGRFVEVSGWNLENIHSDQVDFHVGNSTIQFSSSLRRCHNYLHGNAGLSKDVAFWQILTLINCKSYDEQVPKSERRFFTTPEELNSKNNSELKKRIQRLYKDLIKTKGNKNLPRIDIEADTLAILVRELSRFMLSEISGDIAGVAFQELVGSSLRGDKGQYFTPRLVVDLMVEVIKPTSNEIVLDPACGTGGFLLSVLDYAKSNSSKSPILIVLISIQ
jgi:type I restriction enzyme M protein